ncbi:MAG: ImmA/IrrE family metallo-endopeptidase [Rhodobacteraceae bacterium]|nr:ImmA/IrrE family metallo-endopeptidase [Paracoccaceae bacterium]
MNRTGTHLPYNPHVLGWARKRTGLALEDVAGKIRVSAQKVADRETGKAQPTIRQGRLLAKICGRHFLELFSETVPELRKIDLAPDYRMSKTRNAQGPKERRALEAVHEWAEEQRLNALALLQDLEEIPPVFPENLRFDAAADVEEAARACRTAMRLPFQDQRSFKKSKRYKFPDILRDHIERLGGLVLKHSALTGLGARGICLFAHPLPVIVFGNESPGAQAFTLAHELGHILLRESGISGPPFGEKKGHTAIEDWCNRFAAAFLAPKDAIRQTLPKPDTPAAHFDTGELKRLSEMFFISPHAMLIRLVSLGYVQPRFYWKEMRPVLLKNEETYKPFGRPPYYGRRYVNAKGRYYTGLVMSAWCAGQITAHNAAEYMGIRNLKHLRDIREDYGF